MADSIKIGSLDISAFKVGYDDCKVYLGDTLLYPQSQPQTLQWITFSNGDTIPSDLHIYGIKGIVNDLNYPFSVNTDDIYVEDAGRNKYSVTIGGYNSPCYGEDSIASNTSVEYIFSNIGCSDYYTVSSRIIANMSNDIQLYIYGSPTPPTPTGSTCYEVINVPITSYTATTYDSVYSFADSKWYMKNNLNQYEEYGIYDTATTLSDLTYYDGKLAVIGTTEYQYSGGTWVSAGTYVTTEVTYDIPSGYSTTYQGQTIPTTFKISVADMNVLGTRYISIYDNTNTSYYLQITKTYYRYRSSTTINGTVTSDSDYYYFTLTDAKPSIEIYRTRGYNGTVHIITEQSTPSVLYQEKDMPLAKAYQSVAAMETEACPTVGVGQYGVVGSAVYQFSSTELWVTAGGYYKVFEKNANGEVNVVGCNSNSELTTGDTKPSYFDYSGITEAIIGDCTITIGKQAFYNCSGLTTCTIGSGVTSIGSYVFQGCSGLTSIDIPSSVTSIGDGAFYYCFSLTSCTIGSGVTSIGGSAFNGCSGLTSITIPTSVTSIGGGAFIGCSSLPVENNIRYADTYVIETIDKTLTTYTIKSNSRFINNSVFSGCTALASVTIPNSVISIGGYVFADCTSLTSCTIGTGVTSIDNSIFANCSSLKSVGPVGSGASIEIPNSVTYIGLRAFQNCRSLTSVTIGGGVTSIGNNAFGDCSGLTSCTIGSGVTSIGKQAFRGCSAMTSITCLATVPPTLNTYVFDNTNNCPIYVPSVSVNTYKSASGWSDYASRIQAIPTPTYQWVSYQNGDTVPTTTTVYGVKIYLNYDEDYNIIFSGATGDYIRFYPNNNFGQWSAEDENGNPINISSYFDGYDGVYTILFSDLGMGGMNTISPSTTFEDDIELYEIQ